MIPPHECADPNHPCNRAGKRGVYEQDFKARAVALRRSGRPRDPLILWRAARISASTYILRCSIEKLSLCPESSCLFGRIVFNGIILSNPATECANYTIKDPVKRLKLVEFGGRPMFYLYSAFRDNGDNWMGNSRLGMRRRGID